METGIGVTFTPPSLARRLAEGLGGDLPGGVLDPSCGRGDLLLAAWEASGRCETVAAEGLFGIELDPDLARETRRRLRERIGGRVGERAARHVLTADGLDPAVAWPQGLHVLSNPPWGSLSGRQAVRLPKSRRELYLEAWPSMAGWPSLHGAFLERIARHLEQHGTRGRILLPASVCDLEGYGPLRQAVTEHCELVGRPVDLGERAFEGVVEPAVLVELTGVRPRTGGRASTSAWSPVAPDVSEVLEALRRFPRLDPACFGDPGVHTGNSASELVVDDSESRWPPVREGKDLEPYRLGPPRRRLRTDLERTEERRFRIGSREAYERVPVLLRQTANRPIAALHTEPTYFRNSLLACIPPADLDPLFCVAVLNGPVAGAWHRWSFRDARQRSFPQVKVSHLRSQPFPIAARGEAPELHDRVVELARVAAGGAEPGRAALDALSETLLHAFGLPEELERRVLAAEA